MQMGISVRSMLPNPNEDVLSRNNTTCSGRPTEVTSRVYVRFVMERYYRRVHSVRIGSEDVSALFLGS